MSLRGRSLVPIRRGRRIGGPAQPAIQHVSQTKLRGGDTRLGRQLQSLARDGEIARPHMPVQIDCADDAVRFPHAVSRGFIQPSQRLVGIGRTSKPEGNSACAFLCARSASRAAAALCHLATPPPSAPFRERAPGEIAPRRARAPPPRRYHFTASARFRWTPSPLT